MHNTMCHMTILLTPYSPTAIDVVLWVQHSFVFETRVVSSDNHKLVSCMNFIDIFNKNLNSYEIELTLSSDKYKMLNFLTNSLMRYGKKS